VFSVLLDRREARQCNDTLVAFYDPDIIKNNDDAPFGAPMEGRGQQTKKYRYGFMNFEKDDEIQGSGNSIDAGARMLDTRLGKWLSIDPAFAKYPSLSPYALTANNPIWFYEVDGRIIDLSNLTVEQREIYEANIKVLSESKLFATYYRRLQNSETVYTIIEGAGDGGSGMFNPATGKVHTDLTTHSITNELFHAYQSDLGVYDGNDKSVRETEADLVSINIHFELDLIAVGGSWDQGIGLNVEYLDDNNDAFDEGVLTDSFNNDFSKAVDARIEYYKKTSREIRVKAPESYVAPNSGKPPLALQKAIREKSAENLVGPRLGNGDFHAE